MDMGCDTCLREYQTGTKAAISSHTTACQRNQKRLLDFHNRASDSEDGDDSDDDGDGNNDDDDDSPLPPPTKSRFNEWSQCPTVNSA